MTVLFADASLPTNVTEVSYQADKNMVSIQDTITSADSGICNYNQLSSLHIACVKGHYDIVHHLIENGADISSCDHVGKSSLYLACAYGHVDIVKHLLKKGADVNHCDNDSASPLYVACQEGHTSIVKLLIKHGAVAGEKTQNIKSDISN